MFDKLPPLNSLRAFEAAARLGSFKAAAEELHVTPTAISHQIRALEERLGSSLFLRKTRAVELTDSGEQLARAAHQALQQLAQAVEQIRERPPQLTVATTHAFAALVLAPRLETFYRDHPEIRVIVQTSEQWVDLERDRQVDVAIRYGRPPEQPGVRVLAQEHIGLYGTAGYVRKAATARSITVYETAWQNAQLPALGWTQWHERYPLPGQHVRRRQYSQEVQVIQAALAGEGLALASSLLVQPALQQGWLQPYQPTHTIPGYAYSLQRAERAHGSEADTAFSEWLLATMSDCSH